jgi:hypothetical protein
VQRYKFFFSEKYFSEKIWTSLPFKGLRFSLSEKKILNHKYSCPSSFMGLFENNTLVFDPIVTVKRLNEKTKNARFILNAGKNPIVDILKPFAVFNLSIMETFLSFSSFKWIIFMFNALLKIGQMGKFLLEAGSKGKKLLFFQFQTNLH